MPTFPLPWLNFRTWQVGRDQEEGHRENLVALARVHDLRVQYTTHTYHSNRNMGMVGQLSASALVSHLNDALLSRLFDVGRGCSRRGVR